MLISGWESPKIPSSAAFLELRRLPSWRLVRRAQKEPSLSSTSDGFWDLVVACDWTSVGRMAVSVIQCRTSSQAQVKSTKITHVSGELLQLYLYILWGGVGGSHFFKGLFVARAWSFILEGSKTRFPFQYLSPHCRSIWELLVFSIHFCFWPF